MVRDVLDMRYVRAIANCPQGPISAYFDQQCQGHSRGKPLLPVLRVPCREMRMSVKTVQLGRRSARTEGEDWTELALPDKGPGPCCSRKRRSFGLLEVEPDQD